jgi:exopolyphosphatase/guanosine-5'-triphosphate,3'-diphosphate pyrophosphatase
MLQVGYPLHMVHQYTIGRDEARELSAMISTATRRALERLPGVPRRRIDDLPYAAVVLRRALRATGARRAVFSATGLREGWFMQRMPAEIRAQDPLVSAARHYAHRLARDPALPPALVAWTNVLFPQETPEMRRLREAACWMSDLGSRDHPEFRAEQAFLRVLRQPGLGFDHHARAFLALAIALRYDAEADTEFLRPARLLLDWAGAHRAAVLGTALLLAYTLSAGTPDLLAGTALSIEGSRLVLWLDQRRGVFAGDSVLRRLDRLAQEIGLEAATDVMRETVG